MEGSVISMGGQISGQPAQNPSADLIKDSTTKTFMADVIEASRQVPVIVDFWAPWCGPCKQLTPAIEKAVREAGGKVRLVKVNIDENQALAGQMRIQSIPAVFAFVGGQPVDGFMGALPDSEIKAFIDRVAGQAGPDKQIEELLAMCQKAFDAGEFAQAAQGYAQVAQADRENTQAIAGLAKCQIELEDLQGAEATLSMTPPDKADDQYIVSARAALELAATPADHAEITRLTAAIEADENNHQARLDLTVELNAAGRREEAVDHLITIIRRQRDWNDEAARKQLLKFFEAWGPTDEMTVAGRRKLSAILFS